MLDKEIDFKKIAKIANLVRKILFRTNNNNYNFNLNLMNKSIKNILHIEILYTNSSLFDGCIKLDSTNNKPEIIISRQDSYFRQEFTIAHELGHLFLHWKWYLGDKNLNVKARNNSDILDACDHNQVRTLYRGKPQNSGDKVELEANEFAGNLLMPADGVKKIYSNSVSKNFDFVKQLISNQYDVSTDAAYHRLINLKERGEL